MTTPSQRGARSGRRRPAIAVGCAAILAALVLTLAIAPAGAGHASAPSGGAVSRERPDVLGDEILVRFRPGTSRRERLLVASLRREETRAAPAKTSACGRR